MDQLLLRFAFTCHHSLRAVYMRYSVVVYIITFYGGYHILKLYHQRSSPTNRNLMGTKVARDFKVLSIEVVVMFLANQIGLCL